ncbi:hypothetical protein ACIA3K_12910 [Micromonospora sp. NPDC051543]
MTAHPAAPVAPVAPAAPVAQPAAPVGGRSRRAAPTARRRPRPIAR